MHPNLIKCGGGGPMSSKQVNLALMLHPWQLIPLVGSYRRIFITLSQALSSCITICLSPGLFVPKTTF